MPYKWWIYVWKNIFSLVLNLYWTELVIGEQTNDLKLLFSLHSVEHKLKEQTWRRGLLQSLRSHLKSLFIQGYPAAILFFGNLNKSTWRSSYFTSLMNPHRERHDYAVHSSMKSANMHQSFNSNGLNYNEHFSLVLLKAFINAHIILILGPFDYRNLFC